MKTIKYFGYTLCFMLALSSCKQDVIDLKAPDPDLTNVGDDCPDGTSAGTASFTKFVAIGNSFVAGMQGGALFTEGQNNSLAAILNKQFVCAGGSSTFNQPTIGATLGYNLFVTQPFLTDNSKPILGRMLLQYGTTPSCSTGKVSATPTPQAYSAGELEALPDPSVNTKFMYSGDKSKLNNFGVPAITLGQLLTTATGNWANPDPANGFSPFYGRFASSPGTSKIIGDAIGAGGSFFLFWAGLDDFFLYSAYGADPNYAPLTGSGTFSAYYNAAVGGLLASNSNLKGVIANFPNIFKMPHFTAVVYNPIPLDQASVTALNTGFSGYNAALDGLVAYKDAFGISDELVAEIGTRKVTFEVSCNNKILLIDETLTDLGSYFDELQGAGAITAGQRAGLIPYEQVRQTTSSDIIPLATGSILGTAGTFGLYGVSEPVGDRWVIIPTERDEILTARTAFNASVKAFADANSTRVAFADIDAALETLITNQVAVMNNVAITPNINPPTGIYSEDGVHPNSRGYAFLSTVIISAINANFGSTIPLTNLAKYSATGLPIPAAQ